MGKWVMESWSGHVKRWKLDEEEQAVLRAFEGGELKSLPNVKKEIERHRQNAAHHLMKKQNRNERSTD